MKNSKKKFTSFLIDIWPIKNGEIDFGKVNQIKPSLNLKKSFFSPKKIETSFQKFFSSEKVIIKEPPSSISLFSLFKKLFIFYFIIILIIFSFSAILFFSQKTLKKVFFLKNNLLNSFSLNLKLKQALISKALQNFEINEAQKEINSLFSLYQSFNFLTKFSFLKNFYQKFKNFFLLKEKGERLTETAQKILILIQKLKKEIFLSLTGDPYASKNLFKNLELLKKNFKNFKKETTDSSFFSFLPPSLKKEVFLFQMKSKEIEESFNFLEKVLAKEKPKTYLILLQNNSEIRATGGFLGSFVFLTLNYGRIIKFKVFDIYDPDGQLKKLNYQYIPPKPLWPITATWGARDANWFFDFPTSAKKIIFFLEKSGYFKEPIDGVFAVNTFFFKDLLKILGPIKIEASQKIINADNFLETLEAEVEIHKRDNPHPKKILGTLALKLYQKFFLIKEKKIASLLKILKKNLISKEIQIYFRAPELQKFIERYYLA